MGLVVSTVSSYIWGVADPAGSTEPNGPLPEITSHGSKVFVYKQHPSVSQVGSRVVWLPIDIRPGPETDSVTVPDASFSPTDSEDNYLYDPIDSPDAFDAVHTLAVVEKVRLMFMRALGKENSHLLQWQWGTVIPLSLHTRAGEKANAFYERSDKSLNFYYFKSKLSGKKIYICHSWDTVAHETGHAILDGFQPGWIEPLYETTERGALHEAFGDLTAIFSVLDQLDMCELIVAHTKGDLRNRQNVLAVMGEEFAHAEGYRDFGLRNAADNLKMSDALDEIHDLSRVFTGAVYDVLARMFAVSLSVSEYSPAETLFNVGRYLLIRFLSAIIEAPKRKVTFEDVALLMIKNEPVEPFRVFMQEEFERREVFDKVKRPKLFIRPQGEERHSCCAV